VRGRRSEHHNLSGERLHMSQSFSYLRDLPREREGEREGGREGGRERGRREPVSERRKNATHELTSSFFAVVTWTWFKFAAISLTSPLWGRE
jgi:hypothetical protein